MTQHRRITGKLVIATHNPGKLAEMRELLAPYGIEAVSAGELDLDEPEETGDNFAPMRGSRPSPQPGTRRFPPLPTITVWSSMRSTAHPASTPRAGPASPRISPPP
jgi:hypothetical protein